MLGVSTLKIAASKLAKNKLDLVAVQDVRWVEGGSQPPDDYIFYYGNGNVNCHLGMGCIVHKGIVSAVKRVEFISDRMSYIRLRGRWCDVIVLNVHALTENKSYDTKDSAYWITSRSNT
jgi:hypothetical protein